MRAGRTLYVDLKRERPATRIRHELDGIDQPVTTHRLLVTGSALWGAWLDYRPGVIPDVLVGMSAGGTIPTIAVAIAAGLPFHLAWPVDRDVSDGLPAGEPGFRRAEFLVSERVRGKRVLVVDDEVAHGHTVASFVSALCDEAADVVGVLCMVEDTTGAGRQRVESTGVALCTAKPR